MVNCVLLNTPQADVYAQMAADEFFVNSSCGGSILRFFNWTQGTYATFGYAQFEGSVKAQIAGFNAAGYTRRPTGGGIVLHKDDLTFSLIFNSPQLVSPKQIYAALHGNIKEELAKITLGVAAYNGVSDYRPASQGQAANCFTNPVEDDILDGSGAKVLGGAIRRFGDKVLYQGSLQFACARGKAQYIMAVKAGVLKYLGASSFLQRSASGQEWSAILDLAKTQYQTKEWIEKF